MGSAFLYSPVWCEFCLSQIARERFRFISCLRANMISPQTVPALGLLSGLPTSTASPSRTSYVSQFMPHVQIQDPATDSLALVDTLDIATWSAVECGLAVTAGSLATLKPLFRLISQKLGLKTAAVTRSSFGVPGLPSPSLITSPLVAPEKYPLVSVVLRSSLSSSPKTSLRESMLTSTAPRVWTQNHDNHDEYSSVTGEVLEHYEHPRRPASVAPTLPQLSTGTWRFSSEDIDDMEKGTTSKRWTDIPPTMKPLL